MNANCSPMLATMGALASIPMGGTRASVSMAGQERAAARTSMTARIPFASMVPHAMTVWLPSTAHVLWARQVAGVYITYFFIWGTIGRVWEAHEKKNGVHLMKL